MPPFTVRDSQPLLLAGLPAHIGFVCNFVRRRWLKRDELTLLLVPFSQPHARAPAVLVDELNRPVAGNFAAYAPATRRQRPKLQLPARRQGDGRLDREPTINPSLSFLAEHPVPRRSRRAILRRRLPKHVG